MATLALSLAGQFAGGLVGGPIGATIGRAVGAFAGSAIDSVLFAEPEQPKVLPEFRLQGSAEGGAIPRLYGWSRLSGNIIWATAPEEIVPETSGGKGMLFGGGEEDDDEEPVIATSFAIGLCEGYVHRLGRIWADGQLLETEGLTIRFHQGSEAQGVDSLIEAVQGTGAAPAYRGLCYLVFERLVLAPFGNRIPNIAVELCRVVGELEPMVRAITVIPGSTEYGYDPVPRVRIVGPGATVSENAHLLQRTSDWSLSIDELCDLCPNLTNVALVVAWFGTDLRAGSCTIVPKVEDGTRVIDGAEWSVAGVTRDMAGVVSSYGGGPAYGGTPSDAAVLAAIADLHARGLAVTLYPIVLMDIPHGNGMGQPPYPWRGRITSAADGTAGVTADTGAFADELRAMLLHYAQLCDDAGGVDAFVLGSELRGMTFLRDHTGAFPFVAELRDIAADVAAIIPGSQLTYGADWSEFSGLQAGGDKLFHLDPLWADTNIDAVGIDNYMPLSDWRDGTGHADAEIADGPYQLEYLQSRIAGGEGYDWYYASDADRVAGARTPITDGAHGEPWVWRFKDLASWWGNAHHNRVGGVRVGSPTAWTAGMKPIWFTELGCGATDKGANQPNIFGDPKSSENGSPYFSTGAPDPLMQRQFLRAHLEHWQGSAMVDPDRIYLWTWDSRPFPAFPEQGDVWADAANHATGHWLTGRLGGAATDELIAAMAADYGVEIAAADAMPPLVQGAAIEAVVSCREAMAPVLEASGLVVREGDDGLSVETVRPRLATKIDDPVAADGPLTARRRPDPSEAIGQVALSYPDRGRDYHAGTVTAMRLDGGAAAGVTTNLVLDLAGARGSAERMLRDRSASRDTLELTLPNALAALEAGDVIAVEGESDGPFEITEIRDAEARRISAKAVAPVINPAILSGRPNPTLSIPPARAAPLIVAAHLPGAAASRLVVAALADPWPGEIVLREEATGAVAGRIARPGHVGVLADDLASGPAHYWDARNTVTVTLHAGHLSSTDDDGALAGANRIAVQLDSGSWEIIAFAEAELVAPGTYELSRLLRGQGGTFDAATAATAGNAVIVLDERVAESPVESDWLGETIALRAYAGVVGSPGTELEFAL